jgi:hypothetical protein
MMMVCDMAVAVEQLAKKKKKKKKKKDSCQSQAR